MEESHDNKQEGGRISPNVVLLGAVSFLNDASSEMIMPILPRFITALGGAGVAVGLIGGVRDSVSSILKIFCGYWSDRSGRRKIFVTSGYFSSSVFKLLLALSRTWHQLFIFSGLERVGKGLRSAPRDAIIADSMPGERGKGFGIHRALDSLGAIVGSLAAFFLIWYAGAGFRTVILAAAVVSFAALVPLRFVRDKKREPKAIALSLGLRALPRPLKAFVCVSGLFAMANFSYMFFILRAGKLFPDEMSVAGPILLYSIFNVFYAVCAVPFGALSDRVGRKGVLIAGYLLHSATCLGFAFVSTVGAGVALFSLYGVVHAIIDGNQRAYVSDLAPGGLRATALGTFHTVAGLAALPAGLIAGLLWQLVGAEAAFLYGSAAAAVSAALFAGLGRDVRTPSSSG